MTGADRSVLVRLFLNATQFKEESRSAGRVTDDTTKRIEHQGAAAGRAEKDIDRYSGRLRLLGEAAAYAGPLLIPLGGAAVTGVAALTSGLVAAGGAAGTLLLALHGVGDGLKALQKYKDDPTAKNLQAVREEFEKLGPSGEHFVRYLDEITPQLKELQLAARAGMLPGFEESIDALLTKAPQVQQIIANISEELGSVAADAGDSLAGPKFEAFFDYLQHDAVPILDDFLRSTGNVAEGLANLLVAFNPASQGFSDGLLDMTSRFAEWSRTLDDNQSFQEFLDYLDRTGPDALAFLGSFVDALAAVTRAAAPWGEALLPVFTKVLDLTAQLANSPLGTPLFTAVAAMLALSRAITITSASMTKLGASSATTTATVAKLKSLGGAAVGLLAVGSAVGAIADGIGRIDTENLDRSLTALGLGNVTGEIDDVVGSLEELVATRNSIDLGEIVTAGGLFGDSTLDKYADNVDQVDQKLAQLVETGQKVQAQDLFSRITALAEEQGVSVDDVTKAFDAYALALGNTAGESEDATHASDANAKAQNRAAAATEKAAIVAQRHAAALKEEKAAARETGKSFVGLGDDVNNAKVSLDKWITQLANQAQALENFTANALKAAHRGLDEGLIKSLKGAGTAGAMRMAQLADATDKELDRANKAWRRGEKAIRDYVNMEVPPKKVDADTRAAMQKLRALQAQLSLIKDKDVRVNYYINTMRSGTKPELHAPEGSAAGSTVPHGGPYVDKHLYLLAPGEEVVSNSHGQADAHRGLLKAISARKLANGGTTGGSPLDTFFADNTHSSTSGGLSGAAGAAASSLSALSAAAKKELASRKQLLQHEIARDQKALAASQKQVDLDKQKRDAIVEEIKSIREEIAARYQSDVFGQRTTNAAAQVDPSKPDNWDPTFDADGVMTNPGMTPEQQTAWLDTIWRINQSAVGTTTGKTPLEVLLADIKKGRQAKRLQRKLKKAGISGDALLYAEEHASPAEMRALAADPTLAKQYQAAYATREKVTRSAGQQAAMQHDGKALRDIRDTLAADRKDRDEDRKILKAAQGHLSSLDKTGPERTGTAAGTAVGRVIKNASSAAAGRR